MKLGDATAAALEKLGITSERIESWLGVPCNCEERRIKLNQLDTWARRIIKGRTERALDHLQEILEQP